MASDKFGISVVICTYNGRDRLQHTLKSVLQQKFHLSLFELIVVDNKSTDDTYGFCQQILSAAASPFSWKVIREENPGLNHARLRGLQESLYDFVLYCDDDNVLTEEYLQIGYDILKNNSAIGALGGCGIPSFETQKPDWFDRYSHSFAVGPQSVVNGKLLKYPAWLYGAGTFYRKTALLAFFEKGFNTIMTDRKGNTLASGGDVEWCYLVQLVGYEIWYDQRLTFQHSMPHNRMKWEYYLRLKQGIASGACRLLPYACLLHNRKMSLLTFGFRWMSETVMATLIHFKHRMTKLAMPKPIRPEVDLARVVLRAKVESYWLDAATAFRHFLHLKKML